MTPMLPNSLFKTHIVLVGGDPVIGLLGPLLLLGAVVAYWTPAPSLCIFALSRPPPPIFHW
jgi:hypothetical protein